MGLPIHPDTKHNRACTLQGRTGRALLMACVVISGAAIMLDEFVAVRILARYFGSALDVWASVISVLLLGLSAGYAVGGRIADSEGSLRPIAWALIVAGVAGAVMEPLASRCCSVLLQWDQATFAHPYIAAAVVSFTPVLALGTVLPQAIRLQAEATGRMGASAGTVSAISTAGSILGVLLTVHLLLPRWGVREALFAASALLIVVGAVTWVLSRRSRFLMAWACLFLLPAGADAQVFYDHYSAYHHILVEDVGDKRLLRFDSDVQSMMSLRNSCEGGFEYTEFFHVPIVLDPTINSVLFVGLGGATGPKAFYCDYPHISIHVVEIDPEVVEVAKRWFALPQDARLRVTESDGRVVMQRRAIPYGAIIVDAYASGPYGAYIPYQLATQEFFQLAWRRLDNGGSLVYNVVGVYGGEFDPVVRSMHATLLSVFKVVYVFQAASSLNTVFVAQKIDSDTLRSDGTRDGRRWPEEPWLRHPLSVPELQGLAASLQSTGFVRRGLSQRMGQISGIQNAAVTAPIYTDNYAPVDIGASRRRLR